MAIITRQRVKNSAFTGSGAMGAGDRGGNQVVAFDTSNPYNTNNFVQRWRSYVQMYETSWEARKIVRIIPEDAMRKDWIIEDMPEEMAKKLHAKLTRLKFPSILLRSLMLERLLGGCLTFMGLEEEEDDPSLPFRINSGKNIHFLNAIPVSRIARVNWDTNPLSEHYMRPDRYMVNGQDVHASRCLVWDGEPLFDPFDFALTNFRVNLAGFGPSKLASVWDDIIKAVGTRQAAYQLIQTNNAIIVAMQDLQDLQGTKSGKAALAKVKDIANQISLYRAAVIDAEKVDFQQKASNFGSVPELILTFIQILSAASDIPATRFIGQAPGGLNATGESDLENYYNVIDAYQRQRIEPAIRKIHDVIGYQMFPESWHKVRENYTIKFPPMWNASELEEAQAATARLDNVLKLYENNLISEDKVLEEINAKNCLSVNLDATDISVLEEAGVLGTDVNPQDEIDKLKGKSQAQVPATFKTKPQPGAAKAPAPEPMAKQEIKEPSVPVAKEQEGKTEEEPKDPKQISNTLEEFDPEQIAMGMNIEQEHFETAEGDEATIAGIVMDHLREDPEYYSKLSMIENAIDLGQLPEPSKAQQHAGNYKKHHLKLHGMEFAIENHMGSTRKGTDESGNDWESTLPAHYGYIKKTEGADSDHVDAFVGPNEDSELVFVVDQNKLTGGFDEHKVIFGCLSMTQAKALYSDAYSDGLAEKRIGGIAPMHVEQFKQWLKDGDTKKPYINSVIKRIRRN